MPKAILRTRNFIPVTGNGIKQLKGGFRQTTAQHLLVATTSTNNLTDVCVYLDLLRKRKHLKLILFHCHTELAFL